MNHASRVVSRVIAVAALISIVSSSYCAGAEPPPPLVAKTTIQATQLSPPDNELASDLAAAPVSNSDKLDVDYVKGFATDTGKILSSPLHWQTGDWIKTGLVLGGTGSLMLLDQGVKNFAQKHQSSVASGFATFGTALGEPLNLFPALGAAYLYGHLADDTRVRRTSLIALESVTISGLATMGIKTIASRHRPKSGATPNTWDGPSLSTKNDSFSSGHTSNAFAVATVVANEYGDNPYVAPAAYSLATLTALSRIYKNEHWLSDTFFGAAVGYFTSKAVLQLHQPKGKPENRLSFVPQVGKEMTGLTMNYKF